MYSYLYHEVIVIKKNNLIAAAAAFLLILTAVVTITVISTLSAHRTVPKFVYSDEPQYSDSEDNIPAETTFASNETALPTENVQSEERSVLLTSNDPLHYAEIVFDGFDINISGVYEGEKILSVYLDSEGTAGAESFAYDGSSFSAALKDKHPDTEYDTLIFRFNNKIIDYRIRVTPTGFASAVSDEVVQRSAALTDSDFELPIEGVREYISSDSETISETLAQIQDISDKICDGIDSGYDKLRAISEWVSENIYYDFDASQSSVTSETLSLSQVLETHRTVCGGFSNIFAALCAAQGIECFNIRGTAITGGACYSEPHTDALHEWNYAVVDEQGIWVDTVWNTYNSYSKGVYHSGETHLQYFDVTGEALSLDHSAVICEHRDYFAALEGAVGE